MRLDEFIAAMVIGRAGESLLVCLDGYKPRGELGWSWSRHWEPDRKRVEWNQSFV